MSLSISRRRALMTCGRSERNNYFSTLQTYIYMHPKFVALALFTCTLFSCKKDKDIPKDANETFSETMNGLMKIKTYDQSGNYTTDTTEGCSVQAKIYGADSAIKVTILDPNGSTVRSGSAIVTMNVDTDNDKIRAGETQDCNRIQLNTYSGKWVSSFTPTCSPGGQVVEFFQY